MTRPKFQKIDARGVLDSRPLPDPDFDSLWESIFVPATLKDRLLAQGILNFTLRQKVSRSKVPLHGVILLVGPPEREGRILSKRE